MHTFRLVHLLLLPVGIWSLYTRLWNSGWKYKRPKNKHPRTSYMIVMVYRTFDFWIFKLDVRFNSFKTNSEIQDLMQIQTKTKTCTRTFLANRIIIHVCPIFNLFSFIYFCFQSEVDLCTQGYERVDANTNDRRKTQHPRTFRVCQTRFVSQLNARQIDLNLCTWPI